MIHLRLTRRDLGTHLAKGSLLYALARALPAEAAPTAKGKIKRFVVVYMPEGPNPRVWNGTFKYLTNLWCPVGSGMDHPIGDLSPILGGFADLKADLLVLDGLVNQGYVQHADFGDHFFGLGTVLTGGNDDKGISIDQAVVPTLQTDAHLRPSIHLGVGGGFSISRIPGGSVSGWKNPAEAFQQLFKDFSPAMPVAADPFPESAKRRLLIDRYLDEYKDLKTRIGRSEQASLDSNVTALVELQKRTSALATQPVATCTKPSSGTLPSDGSLSWDKLVPPTMDVLAAAFACDLTRVATVEIGHPYMDKVTYPWLGVNDGHHALAHSLEATRNPALQKIYRWYFDQVAYLARKLKATPDPDGGSVLDHTAIITVSEFGDGSHTTEHMAVTLIGGSAAGVKGGRVLHYSPNYGDGASAGQCEPINRLHLTIAGLVGMDMNVFGEPSYCAKGPLTGVV